MDRLEAIEQFRNEIIDKVYKEREYSADTPDQIFMSEMCNYLKEAEIIDDYNLSFSASQSLSLRIDGYSYNEADHNLILFIVDWDDNLDRTVTKTEIERNIKKTLNFLKKLKEVNKTVESYSQLYNLLEILTQNQNDINVIRIYVFTNGKLSERINELKQEDFKGIPVETQAFDIARIYSFLMPNEQEATIEIDFSEICKNGNGIPCLETPEVNSRGYKYKSYLGIIPGSVLADIYEKYGSRLLEGNVRSFLSTKVAVNKKIRATILTCPERFFAFNNGISVTVEDLVVKNTPEGNFISKVRDFQIINGGQTTASLLTAKIKDKDKADLSKINVQMKLTYIEEVPNNMSISDFTKSISISSNSQNKVNDADFFASHDFHKTIEQLSKTCLTPIVAGKQFQTYWFYERSRGQYLNSYNLLTKAKAKEFQNKHPKDQKLSKTDLAQVQNCWLMHPDIVSKGAQTNFTDFAKYIEEEWKNNRDQFNKLYFQNTCALRIMFLYLKKEMESQDRFGNSYRANFNYYTIALLHFLLNKQYPKYEFNLNLIWNKQKIEEDLGKILIEIAFLVKTTITAEDREVTNVTQWCKRKACWEEVQAIQYTLPKTIEKYLIANRDLKAQNSEAVKDQKITSSINDQAKLAMISKETWVKIKDFLVNQNQIYLTERQSKALSYVLKYGFPAEKDIKFLKEILDHAKNEGFEL